MWIGQTRDSIAMICKLILFTPSPKETFANIMGIIGMTIDEKGQLWVGSQEGVYSIDSNSRESDKLRVHHYKNKLDAPKSSLVEKSPLFFSTQTVCFGLGATDMAFTKECQAMMAPTLSKLTTTTTGW